MLPASGSFWLLGLCTKRRATSLWEKETEREQGATLGSGGKAGLEEGLHDPLHREPEDGREACRDPWGRRGGGGWAAQ